MDKVKYIACTYYYDYAGRRDDFETFASKQDLYKWLEEEIEIFEVNATYIAKRIKTFLVKKHE